MVTLVPIEGARCLGAAYLLDAETVHETFEQLDYREKNGYERFEVVLDLEDNTSLAALIYAAERIVRIFRALSQWTKLRRIDRLADNIADARSDLVASVREAVPEGT